MRLKTIKLAGFKSFVDPTVLHLPSNLIGVVGPNGCGKSNIIDAVRWVMGETSAKLLRGDSMSDVIFNGSSARKPVSAATVELIFDNSDGTVAGEYASFSEISIKRQVVREGQSFYFLNGSKCRRRDIVDIFLGTGLGPRSYSIIEQGMISKLIESRPEELRNHLEEAAGISKYRERRRETENRIRHTRENLERLDDLRGEVDAQLRRLDRQAKQAERYKKLKDEHRQREAELIILQWESIESDLSAQSSKRKQVETEREKHTAELRQAETRIEKAREKQAVETEALNKVQSEVYGIGGQIARIEQAIQHRRENRERQLREQQQAEQNWQDLQKHLDLDRVQQEELRRRIDSLEPELKKAREQEQADEDVAQAAEARLSAWQSQWDDFSTASNETSRDAEIERTRISHLDAKLTEHADRLKSIEKEDHSGSLTELQERLSKHGKALTEAREKQATQEQQLHDCRQSLIEQNEKNREQTQTLDEVRQSYQQARGRLSSLEALQQAALGRDKAGVSEWLAQHGLADDNRLAEMLQVESGWEAAVETVMGDFLEAIVSDQPLGTLMDGLNDAPSDLVVTDNSTDSSAGREGTLMSKVTGPAVVAQLLSTVRIAHDIDEAQTILPSLADHESVITASGEWLGSHWVRVSAGEGGNDGVIGREQEIKRLKKEQQALEKQGNSLKDELEQGELSSRTLEQQRDDLQTRVNELTRKIAELAANSDSCQSRIDHLTSRSEQLVAESKGLISRLDEDTEAVKQARERLQSKIDSMSEFQSQRGTLEAERDDIHKSRKLARETANESRQKAQGMAIDLETRRANLTSVEQALERTRTQLQQLDERRKQLLEQIEESDEPIQQESEQLKALVASRHEVDKRLEKARAVLDQINLNIRELEQARLKADQSVSDVRDRLEQMKLDEQSLKVHNETLASQFADSGYDREQLKQGLDEAASASQHRQEIEKLETRITRLEPVNLAAIQELEEQQERKQYLDSQHDDLTEALSTLEAAIHKIDKKTRTRFKETFDNVNTGLKKLFPRLFGGGHAYLELVGDDLLTAGVAIFARPPGKRISNIHLMSGGEKALTAVALVFSIFQLNPAPFCMLDEVDAPLDDANVGRFSDMLTEMSESVQFLFVSHNKITMEIAHQLSGVTMREAGVSRMVSVDVNEAEKMANA